MLDPEECRPVDPMLARLYPNLTSQELAETALRLDEYLGVITRISARLESEGQRSEPSAGLTSEGQDPTIPKT